MKQPGAKIGSGLKMTCAAEGAHIGLLDQIFRFYRIAGEPAGQIVQPVQVGQRPRRGVDWADHPSVGMSGDGALSLSRFRRGYQSTAHLASSTADAPYRLRQNTPAPQARRRPRTTKPGRYPTSSASQPKPTEPAVTPVKTAALNTASARPRAPLGDRSKAMALIAGYKKPCAVPLMTAMRIRIQVDRSALNRSTPIEATRDGKIT